MLSQTNIYNILKKAVSLKATDIHLVQDKKPKVRILGELIPLDNFEPVDLISFIESLPGEIQKKFNTGQLGEYDFSFQISNMRFRVNVFKEMNGFAVVFRYIPTKIRSLRELDLPVSIEKFVNLSRGLVLITGPTGSGKSTTLAAIIDAINSTRKCRIITIEDPVEYIHEDKKAFISHREIVHHTTSFANALRGALREDPDVILLGEMRDLETIDLAIKAALTGHLVFSTLHTSSAPKTIDRIIQVFPSEIQAQVKTDLADVIEGVVAQVLIPKKDKTGLVAATEIMFANTAIRNLIREGKTYQIRSIMQTSKNEGMMLLDDCLEQLVKNNVISRKQALLKAHDKSRFLHLKTKIQLAWE